MRRRFQLVALAALVGLSRFAPAATLPFVPPLHAARFAVPILCTEHLSGRTRARGTAIIVDPSGIILTAAHVVLENQVACTLTAMVPDDDWDRASRFYLFSVGRCASDALLDLAACRIQSGDNHNAPLLRAASVRGPAPAPGTAVTITGFTGWGLFPTVVRGRLTPGQSYRRKDGCYCDFAVDAEVYEGMSGSPVETEQGRVIGLITTAGTGPFRGTSFGTSLEYAAPLMARLGAKVGPNGGGGKSTAGSSTPHSDSQANPDAPLGMTK